MPRARYVTRHALCVMDDTSDGNILGPSGRLHGGSRDPMLAHDTPLASSTERPRPLLRSPLREVPRLVPRPAPYLAAPPEFEGMVGRAPAMRELFEFVARLAPYPTTALIIGRERHRQGAGRPRHPPAVAAQPAAARRLQLHGARPDADRDASCSATCAAPSPAPTGIARASSRRRTAARSSSTRSASCPSRRRRSCCACSRSARSAASGRTEPHAGRRARHRRDQSRPGRARGERGRSATTSTTG